MIAVRMKFEPQFAVVPSAIPLERRAAGNMSPVTAHAHGAHVEAYDAAKRQMNVYITYLVAIGSVIVPRRAYSIGVNNSLKLFNQQQQTYHNNLKKCH